MFMIDKVTMDFALRTLAQRFHKATLYKKLNCLFQSQSQASLSLNYLVLGKYYLLKSNFPYMDIKILRMRNEVLYDLYFIQ